MIRKRRSAHSTSDTVTNGTSSATAGYAFVVWSGRKNAAVVSPD